MRNICLGFLLPLATLSATTDAEGQCVLSSRSAGAPVGYDAVQLVPNGIPSNLMSAFSAAYGAWNSPTCNQDGDSFPTFQTTANGAGRTVGVTLYSGFNPVNNASCGRFSGNDISLYTKINLNGNEYSCTDPAAFQDTISHELGHLLGLNNVAASCGPAIMGPRVHQGGGNFKDRNVTQAECNKVAETNETPSERTDPCDSPLVYTSPFAAVEPLVIPCDDGGGAGGDSGPGGAGEESGGSNSGTPIILNLDARGFRLTSLEDGVRFDLNGDGWPERVSWTEAGSGDAWLALDRDGSGFIEKGSELFGDYTDQPSSETPHGYRALAVFDEPAQGGNADGMISAADSIYGHLRLWTDTNHDGRSQRSELQSLAGAGVEWIALWTVESWRKDQHGNEFRYMSQIGLGHQRARSADVFLLTAP